MPPNPYVVLGLLLGFLGAITGAFFYGQHIEALSWEASTAALKLDAQVKLDAANALAAAKDAENRSLALKLDAEHEKSVATINATAADFDKRLAVRLRELARCRAGSGGELSRTTVASGQPETVATGGDDGFGGIDPVAVQILRTTALKLQADVKQCWAWAAAVGAR
jgi:hypothetical protein